MPDWTSDQLKKLRAYHASLLGQSETLAQEKHDNIRQASAEVLADEISRISNDFPNLLPPLSLDRLLFNNTRGFYDLPAVKAYLAGCLARLKAELEEVQNTPVTERLEFRFVKDPQIRKIVERDYIEIQRAYVAQCWKSVIILSGGSIEAILLDRLLRNEPSAKDAKSAPAKPDLTRWDLSELLKVAVEIKLVELSAENIAEPARQYRNLVHPGNEKRNRLTVSRLEADSALNSRKIIHRDLSPNHQ
jgi:hypothetical protein